MRTIFEILLLLTIISVGGILITENRHPVKTFCWILIICILPVFGLVLWFFFGASKRNKRLIDDKQLETPVSYTHLRAHET